MVATSTPEPGRVADVELRFVGVAETDPTFLHKTFSLTIGVNFVC